MNGIWIVEDGFSNVDSPGWILIGWILIGWMRSRRFRLDFHRGFRMRKWAKYANMQILDRHSHRLRYVCSIRIHHNGFHNDGRGRRRRPRPSLWRRPKAASIMVDADAANIAKTYANTYPIFAYLHILPIFSENPDGNPGLAKSTAS